MTFKGQLGDVYDGIQVAHSRLLCSLDFVLIQSFCLPYKQLELVDILWRGFGTFSWVRTGDFYIVCKGGGEGGGGGGVKSI